MRSITLTACRRPAYLAQTLEALKRCEGIERYDVTVFCDPHTTAVTNDCVKVVRSFGFDAIVNDKLLGAHANTGLALECAFGWGADYHVHMEEDTVPSRGALLWFEWAERFRDDPSVFTVSGYRREPCGAVDEWDRRQWFTPWGFATWADRWPEMQWSGNINVGWDVRLNTLIRGDRYEVAPCVSRMQNIGAENGVHMRSPALHAKRQHAREVTDELVTAFRRKSGK